jgi:hypothetical protein
MRRDWHVMDRICYRGEHESARSQAPHLYLRQPGLPVLELQAHVAGRALCEHKQASAPERVQAGSSRPLGARRCS